MQFLFSDQMLDTDRRELCRGPDRVAIEPQVFDLLVYLMENRERVVSKDDLIAAIWEGRIVSESTLTSRINAARKAIGDSGQDQKLIRTISRKGFRFVGTVRSQRAGSESPDNASHPADEVNEASRSILSPLDRPAIAVLAFTNMSGDPEQEYFADGIAEDVLTTLSKIQELMVIARNSSFVFKGQTRDVREIGRILGARYVLEGSVRKVGNRVRLSAQLIDSLDGSQLWADRYDGGVDDVFDLQDRITQEIVSALEVQLTLGEQARVWRKRSGSPLVYEYFLKGRSLYLNFARHTHAQARAEFERALEINPVFTPALVMNGYALTDQARFGWEEDRAATYQAALDCAARALVADPGCGEAYTTIGYVRTFQRRHEEAVAAGDKAIALSPSGADAYHMAGMYHGYAGNFRKAALYEEQAQRLSPIGFNVSMVDEARARFHLGDFAAARDTALRVLTEKPRWLTAHSVLVAALWSLGSEDEARVVAKELLVRHPDFSVSRWARGLPYRRQEDLDTLVNPLRMAGLPK
jgi:adenylate cyclase